MTTPTTVADAVAQFAADVALAHAIVQGPATGTSSTVSTENGPVKTLAKVLGDADASVTSQVGGYTTAATNAGNSATTAQTSATNAGNSATTAAQQAAIATAQAATATGQAVIATTQNSNAQVAAASATASSNSLGSAIQTTNGNALAVSNALTTMQGQALTALQYALMAASLAQQDLSGVSLFSLHRSNVAPTALFVYDTSKDGDGGAWVDKCQHLSWYNEPLAGGNWLTTNQAYGIDSELQARTRGATLGSELCVNPDFSAALTGWTFGNATGVIVNGQLRITATANGIASGVMTASGLPVGVLYEGSVDIVTNSNNNFVAVYIRGTTVGGTSTSGTTRKGAVISGNTTEYIAFQWNANIGDVLVIDNVSVKAITSINTKSGDFFQYVTDGKYYRLSRNMLRQSVFTGSGGLGTYPTGWNVLGANANTAQLAQEVVNGTLTGVVKHRRISGSPGLEGLQQSGTGTLWVGNFGIRVLVRVPTGVTASDLTFYDGVTQLTVVSAATLNAQAKDVWVAYTVTHSPTTARSFYSFGSPSGAVGTGFDIAQPSLEIGAVTTYEATDNTTIGGSEIYRGNTAKFPRLSAIVAEANRFTIYDLTQPGRPMWRSWKLPTSSAYPFWWKSQVADSITSVFAMQGTLCIGTANPNDVQTGLMTVEFLKDRYGKYKQNTAECGYLPILIAKYDASNVPSLIPSNTYPGIASAQVNAVAMTVMKDAPIDPVTGIQVPTIAVAVGSGNAGTVGCTLYHDGSNASNYNYAGNDGTTVAFNAKNELVWGISNGQALIVSSVLQGATSINLNTLPRLYVGSSAPSIGGANAKRTVRSGSTQIVFGTAGNGGTVEQNKLALLRENPTTPGSSLAASISTYFNSGWMTGDARRTWVTDVFSGTTGPSTVEMTTNGTFNSDVSGWAVPAGTLTWVAGKARITNNTGSVAQCRAYQAISCVVGKTYVATMDIVAPSGGSLVGLGVGTGAGFSTVAGAVPSATTRTDIVTFVAVQATMYIYHANNLQPGETADFDNVSVKESVELVASNGWGVPGGYDNVLTVSANGSVLTSTQGSQLQTRAYLNFATVIGKTYQVSMTHGNGVNLGLFFYNAPGGAGTMLAPNNPYPSGTGFSFTATTTSSSMLIAVNPAATMSLSNITIREVVADRSVKVRNASLNGTLAMNPVGVGSQLVAYTGFTNDTSMLTELVVNGTFNTDVSGWSVESGGTITWVSGAMQVSGTGFNAYQAVPTVAGRKYTFTYTPTVNGSQGLVKVGPAINDTSYYLQGSATSTQTVTFTAKTNLTYLNFQTGGSAVTYDNISLKPVDALGSSANVIQESYSSDLDYGTGAWTATGWFNLPVATYGPLNAIPTSSNTGAVNGVIGSGGALPTGWYTNQDATLGTVTYSVVSSGTLNGVPYIDLRAQFTATGSGRYYVAPSNTTSTLFAGDANNFVSSWFIGQQSGTFTNVTTVINVPLFNSSNALVTDNYMSAVPVPATFTRTSFSAANAASVAKAETRLSFYVSGAGTYDFTVRLGGSQIEHGTVAKPVIITTGAAVNGIAPIIYRGGLTGAYWTLGLDGNGFIAAEAFDGTTTRRVTNGFVNTSATFNKARVDYTTTSLTLKINGEQVAQTTGSAMLTLNNANAYTTLGNNMQLNAAFPGSIALVKTGATSPTVEQSQFMFSQEKQMFRDGAQVTLMDYSPLISVAYDELDDRYRVMSAANESSFLGLVRITNVPVIFGGNWTVVGARSGVRLMGRGGTNAGVDISTYSQNLREEMVNKADAASRLSRPEQVFDFDTVTSQTDFVLPVGYEAVSVTSAGVRKREGSTKDWIRKNDGFHESVSFLVAPGNAVWVQVKARKIVP